MPSAASVTSRLRASARLPLLQVLKVALATVLAWIIAGLLLPTQLPVFAAIAALLVVQPSVNQSVGRALERSLGVIIGVLVATGIAWLFGANSWLVLLGVVISIFLAWALRLTPASASQVPITAMLVLTLGSGTPDYPFVRILETLLGAAIGLVVNITIVPPVHLSPARDAVTSLASEVADCFDRLADALRLPRTPAQLDEMLITARLLRPMQAKAQDALTAAAESLSLNPRQQKLRVVLERYQLLFTRTGPLVTRTLNMTRAVHDHYDTSLREEPMVAAIVDELERAAHDLRLLVNAVDGQSAEAPVTTSELPLLTQPLVIATPHPEHWVLIGSLIEDLRRVHEEIVGVE